ncbi:MAG: DNA polymerase I [Fibrobacterales bacterium]
MKNLVLIDSYAIAFRSYYAFINNPLVNSKEEFTSVLYGYISHLFRVINELDVTHLAIVTDRPEKDFRKEMYEEYKAHRPPMPDDMRTQIGYLNEFLEICGIPVLSKAGYEADDVIATVALNAGKEGYKVFIDSKDKDLMQLVDENICMFNLEKAGVANTIMDTPYVENKMGVPPEQVRDLLALMGDAADNIPGVPKVGIKTAAKLLLEYGSLEGIYENLDNIKAKALNANLSNNHELALLSQKLVTLATEVVIDETLDDLEYSGLNGAVIGDFIDRFELQSLNRAFKKVLDKVVEEDVPAIPMVVKEAQYQLIDSEQSLSALVTVLKSASVIAVDTETSSLNPYEAEIAGICFSVSEEYGFYVAINHKDSHCLSLDVVRTALSAVLNDQSKKLVFHNAKYDLGVFRTNEFPVTAPYVDTMIASYLLNPGVREHSLDAQVKQRLGHSMIPIESLIGKGKSQITFCELTAQDAYTYSAEDAVFTLRLWNVLEKELEVKELTQPFYEIELPLLPVLLDMEGRGISVDTVHLSHLSDKLADRIEELEGEIYLLAGEEFNIASPKQMSVILFEKLELPHGKKTKTGWSTNASVLEKLQEFDIVKLILEYRELSKLKNTYVDVLPSLVAKHSQKIHTSYNQIIAATGRLSSVNPNLQNIPVRTEQGKEIRKAFVASDDDHIIVAADYSQIELRVLAHLSGDPELKKAYQEGADIHTQTAAALYEVTEEQVAPEMRRQAKVINFGVLYGMSAFRLSNDLGITRFQAQEFIDNYFNHYEYVTEYIAAVVNKGRTNEYVETLFGHRRHIPDLNSENGNIRNGAERMAVSTAVQGTAAGIIKKAMINLDAVLKESSLDIQMLLQVHDELVFEIAKSDLVAAKEIIQREMEKAVILDVPLTVEIGEGSNWLQAH